MAGLLVATALVTACSPDRTGERARPRSVPAGSSTPSAAPSATPSATPSAAPSATPSATPSAAPPSRSGTSEAEPPAPADSAFQAAISEIDVALSRRMRFSHRNGCPVPLAELRHLTVSHVRFDGTTATGELVVHRDHARAVVGVFEELYDARWPIRRMRLVDHYEGDDGLSMAADNTSAYNCRSVAGSERWSQHAYGRAIDLNPVENPYVTGSSFVPAEGARFARIDRSPTADVPPGVIHDGDVVVRAFARIGWEWGGHWGAAKDYQHFSVIGR